MRPATSISSRLMAILMIATQYSSWAISLPSTRLSEDTYNATGTQSLEKSLVWLSDYCEMHQMESFNRAIQQLLSTSYESRHRVPPGRERGWGHAVTQEPTVPTPQ